MNYLVRKQEDYITWNEKVYDFMYKYRYRILLIYTILTVVLLIISLIISHSIEYLVCYPLFVVFFWIEIKYDTGGPYKVQRFGFSA